MRKMIRFPLAALLLLGACDRDRQAPSTEDNRRLDEAETMLDAAPDALDAIDDGAVMPKNSAGPNGSEEAPEPADLVYPERS